MSRSVLQQVFYCHWRCGAGAHREMTNVELGVHVMSESAMVCPQFQSGHLVFSRKEVIYILSVVIRMLLQSSSSLPLFHYGLCLLKCDFM